jgi:3-phosphoshikimate 1-carboxyvinyltransferase
MKNLVLVGFMGTGKSAVGRALADRLGLKFVDMDRLIQTRAGQTISQIFQTHGEAHFRQLERAAAAELARQHGLVIATGGGIVLDPANLEHLGRTGLVVCLWAEPEVVHQRTARARHLPLLEHHDRRERVAALLRQREPLYRAIPHQVDTSDKSLAQVVDEVARIYEREVAPARAGAAPNDPAPRSFVCRPSRLRGAVTVPGSKSHTIRAVAIASLAAGTSRIEAPLESGDTASAVRVFRALGARIDCQPGLWTIAGTGGDLRAPAEPLDAGNSGTTVNIAMGTAALLRAGQVTLTGDEQIQRRPNGPLIAALNDLGAHVASVRGNGCPPLMIRGRLRGGTTTIECKSSQYLTSLLLNCPLADGDTVIQVPVLEERPYVEMTLDWLRRQGIQFAQTGLREFRIPGRQAYRPFTWRIPADFSSATFFLCAGAIGDNDVLVRGLDLNDPQGDKAVLDYLRQMGARVDVLPDGIRVRPGRLRGCRLDLNATPDALPMMAVLACFATGTTTLANVAHARIKETDRITTMREELTKLGAKVTELPDGLVIEGGPLTAAEVTGHHDHRIAMALAIAGTALAGETIVHTAESATITFPTFADCLRGLGADVRVAESPPAP